MPPRNRDDWTTSAPPIKQWAKAANRATKVSAARNKRVKSSLHFAENKVQAAFEDRATVFIEPF